MVRKLDASPHKKNPKEVKVRHRQRRVYVSIFQENELSSVFLAIELGLEIKSEREPRDQSARLAVMKDPFVYRVQTKSARRLEIGALVRQDHKED
jgi:hypothetical protein